MAAKRRVDLTSFARSSSFNLRGYEGSGALSNDRARHFCLSRRLIVLTSSRTRTRGISWNQAYLGNQT
jgi:hypothetical protein